MAGGLLNIIYVGKANLILTGNPSKTFFKVTYSKYTNFGLQKFRLDFDGLRELRLNEPSKYTFKVKRYADLFMDTYIVVNLPDIWSPIWEPSSSTGGQWSPYDFKWIDNIGTQIIQDIEIVCGANTLQKYSGQYLHAMVKRDFDKQKLELFDAMTGNVPSLNDPANDPARVTTYPYKSHTYPSSKYTSNPSGAEPSIRGRTLYIPLNAWFTLDSRCAFPLVAIQYQELIINVTLRPIQELFQVRDVFNPADNFPYIKIRSGESQFQMYRFLQTPPSTDLSQINYENTTNNWNSDVHLLSTYCFLSEDEQTLFAATDQVYLVKEIHEYDYLNVVGSNRVKLQSSGMVADWMWYFQRNDVFLRNEWTNYTNWPYKSIPSNIILDATSELYVTGDYSSSNQQPIMETFGILFGGDYREISMPRGVYDYVEKYTRTQGFAEEGLYCYNFCLNTSPYDYQPSGAVNTSRFKSVEFEFTTYTPPIDISGSNVNIQCELDGTPIIVSSKPAWSLYTYNYNLHVFEERYNVLSFVGGNCGLMYAR
jgi:hypothetical protein